MIKALLFLVFLSLCARTSAQNWSLFPIDQKSLYQTRGGWETILIDSVHQGDPSKLFFNPRISEQTCLSDSELSEHFQTEFFLVPKVMNVHSSHSTLISTKGNQIDTFLFYQSAPVGKTWRIAHTDYYFTCDSIKGGVYLYQTDSFKYFSVHKTGNINPIRKLDFVLSKHYGLIRFVPIPKLTFGDTTGLVSATLKGLKKNNIKAGVILPDLQNIFNLHAGDVRYWRFHEDDWNIMTPDIEYYYKDSIIQSTNTDSLVSYYKKVSDRGNTHFQYESYSYKDYKNFLLINPAGAFSAEGWPDHYYLWRYEGMAMTDSFNSITYNYSGEGVITTPCEFGMSSDVGKVFSLASNIGLNYVKLYGWGETTREIVGGIINGVKFGMTNIPLSVNNDLQSKISVYPNPVHNLLYVKTAETGLSYELYSVIGELLDSGEVDSEIDMKKFPSGMYDLHLYKDHFSTHKRVIKMESLH